MSSSNAKRSASDEDQESCSEASAPPSMTITSDEINFLIHRYLREAGFVHSAFTFASESMLGRSSMRSAEKSIPPGALISFLQKGLQYVGIEESLSLHEDNTNKRPDSDFTLLSPHAMQALSRQHPPIQINVPPATAAAALKARLETNAMPANPPPQQQRQQPPPPIPSSPIPAGAAAHAASQAAAAAAAALVSVGDAPTNHSMNFTSHITTSTPTTTTRTTTMPLHLQGHPENFYKSHVLESTEEFRMAQGGFAHLEEAAARLEGEKRIVSHDVDELPTDKRNGSQPQSNGNHSLVDMGDQQTRAPPNEILELKKHASEVFMCAWNPVYTDLIATGSGDASARIWKMGGPIAQDGCLDSLLLPHGLDPKDVKNKDVTTLEWSPDGMLLATGSYDGIARVWNRGGVLVHTLRGHHGPIFSLKWNKSGNFLLSGSYDKTTIVWDVSGNTGFIEQQFNNHFAPALDVDWKDDITFASCSTDKTVQICRVGLATPLKTYQGHTDEVNAVKWDPSGTLLASCSDDCTAKVWDVESGRDDPLHDFVSHEQEIYTVKWSPTGPGSRNPYKQKMLATASFDGSVRLWDVVNGTCIRVLSRHRDSVYSVAFSPSGDYLASGSLAGQLYIWDVREGVQIKSFKGRGDIFEVAWNAEETRVAACFSSNVVSVIDFHPTKKKQPRN